MAVLGCGGDGGAGGPAQPARGPAIAVIGDTPYGAAQVARFREDIAQINADPGVRLVIHLGDIQEGSSPCTDEYLRRIRRDFDTFEDPLVYTPGDNEWTDCHREDKGGHAPTERLAMLRSIFFDRPGRTLGRSSRRVTAQAAPFVENVRWVQDRVVFTTLHVPGSNNGADPWPSAAEQREENHTRLRANLDWLDRAFDEAVESRAVGVVVAMQADTWPPAGSGLPTSAYGPIVAKLAARAGAFARPVLVLQGDSHVFRFDAPLRDSAPNVVRVVVQGATSSPREWLRLRISHAGDVFTWDRVSLDG